MMRPRTQDWGLLSLGGVLLTAGMLLVFHAGVHRNVVQSIGGWFMALVGALAMFTAGRRWSSDFDEDDDPGLEAAPWFRVTCHDEDLDGCCDTLEEAKGTAEAHIVNDCPHGTATWAAGRIEWQEIERIADPRSEVDRRWVAAAGGQWLNHGVSELLS